MQDDSSNDVMEVPTSTLADSPIMQFFKRLISNSSSQNTMLTNAQIQDILTKEFHFDFTKLHELEIEIYVNILKKYLKDWPNWDNFDLSVKELTLKGDGEALSKLLEDRHTNLKKFLQTNLDLAKPLTTECVARVESTSKSTSEEVLNGTDPDCVVLEIQATRDQLNKLFLRYPVANTIFNHGETGTPSQINLSTLSLQAILNWWSLTITINLQWTSSTPSMFLKRETVHSLDHSLVNLKARRTARLVSLNDQWQIKATKKANRVSKNQLINCLDLLGSSHNDVVDGMEQIIECFKTDIVLLPDFCATPAQYRRCLTKYPYVRYLCTDNQTSNRNEKNNYDIRLKETLSPMNQISIGQLDGTVLKGLPPNWLKIDCSLCNRSFMGAQLVTELRQHFDEYHQNEPDWQCTYCEKSFSMPYLASSAWKHKCIDVGLLAK